LRALRAAGAAVAVVAAVVMGGAVVAAWAGGPEPMTADEAAAFTADALAEIGVRDVRVSPDVAEATHEGAPVWSVGATVDGGTVRLREHRDAGEAVRVDDVTTGGDPLLTDAQFAALDELTAGLDEDHRREAWAATLAGVAGAAVALAVAAAVRP
jgi:hypothetical protein